MKVSELRFLIVEKWLTGKYKTYTSLADELIATYGSMGIQRKSVAKAVETYVKQGLLDPVNNPNTEDTLEEVLEELNQEKRKNLKIRDQRNRDNRNWRKSTRDLNAAEAMVENLLNAINAYGKKLGLKVNLDPLSIKKGGTGVIIITDTHGNELVDTPYNKYDFKIFSKRLKKLITFSLSYFKLIGVEKVVILFLGDLMNSDRRPDEKVAMATNRSKALFLTSHLFNQAILEVAQYYPVEVYGVLGNESRINQEFSFHPFTASDNFDFLILETCRRSLEPLNLNITFGPIDVVQQTVKIEDQNWLICHDVNKTTNTPKNSQSVIGKMTLLRDPVEFVVGGHIHSFHCTEYSCRSGSLVGGNDYSTNGIELASKASGVCIVAKDKERYIQYIDLQEADEGYDILEELEYYDVKSII